MVALQRLTACNAPLFIGLPLRLFRALRAAKLRPTGRALRAPQPKPPLRYVCLEPWYGLDDFVDFAGDFSQKPHCQVLAAGQSFAFPMRIVIGM